jgi:hypothetical protein
MARHSRLLSGVNRVLTGAAQGRALFFSGQPAQPSMAGKARKGGNLENWKKQDWHLAMEPGPGFGHGPGGARGRGPAVSIP